MHRNGRLEQLMAQLAASQIALSERQAATDARIADIDARFSERQAAMEERMARADERMAANDLRWLELKQEQLSLDATMKKVILVLNEHTSTLAKHTQMLEALPDAIRDKIGCGRGDKS